MEWFVAKNVIQSIMGALVPPCTKARSFFGKVVCPGCSKHSRSRLNLPLQKKASAQKIVFVVVEFEWLLVFFWWFL